MGEQGIDPTEWFLHTIEAINCLVDVSWKKSQIKNDV